MYERSVIFLLFIFSYQNYGIKEYCANQKTIMQHHLLIYHWFIFTLYSIINLFSLPGFDNYVYHVALFYNIQGRFFFNLFANNVSSTPLLHSFAILIHDIQDLKKTLSSKNGNLKKSESFLTLVYLSGIFNEQKNY